ncbi:MAG TPA: type II secretion system protein GspC [Nitrospiraceae bacterium]|jgi:general secretion pathway protein C|nr:type II secretion system protein GspC [Nitrospiraceae bacterium]
MLRRMALALFLTLSAFLIAHSINAFIAHSLLMPFVPQPLTSVAEPTAPIVPPAQLAAEIRAGSLFPLPAEESSERTLPGQLANVTRPPLEVVKKVKLLGTVMGDQGGISAVLEELATKRQILVRLHERIPEVGELAEIRKDAVVIREGGQEEVLPLALLDQGQAGTAAAASASPTTFAAHHHASVPTHRVLDRREVEQAMADVSKLLMQAHAVPHFTNGTLDGFRIDFIAPASFYEKIGLSYGDVLQRVNGVEVRDPGTMLRVFQQVKNERTVKVDVLRNNQPTTLTYEIR